jgi:hydroxypyruvate reductase
MLDALSQHVVVRGGVMAALERCATEQAIAMFQAGHPFPNQSSVRAAAGALALARKASADGGLLALLSGGASAMLAAPAGDVTLEDKILTARRLMEAGAAIHELNCVRKHLSRIKGGRLAAAAGKTLTLALSDVHGPVADDPSVIASGPTVPDETTYADALEILRARAVVPPASVSRHLLQGARGNLDETIKPGDERLRDTQYVVIGNRHTAARGAARLAEARGYQVIVLPAATSGEAREASLRFLDDALTLAAGGADPTCVIASGETTVTVRGRGTGGRNQEFALSAAVPLSQPARVGALNASGASAPRTVVLGSAGTDGVDGPTDAAGAVVDRTTLHRARSLGLDPGTFLQHNDAYRFFERLGDLLIWGPTGTNVGDLHVLLID